MRNPRIRFGELTDIDKETLTRWAELSRSNSAELTRQLRTAEISESLLNVLIINNRVTVEKHLPEFAHLLDDLDEIRWPVFDRIRGRVNGGGRIPEGIRPVHIYAAVSTTVTDLRSLKWGNYLEALGHRGPRPLGEAGANWTWHCHHTLEKVGPLSSEAVAHIDAGQEILRSYDIDPIFGPENLVWAPKEVKGQHGKAPIEDVVAALINCDEEFGTREEILVVLQQMGQKANRRR